jgi:hypothetical protein
MLYFCAVQYCTGLQSLTGGIKSPRRGWFFGYAKGRLLGDVSRITGAELNSQMRMVEDCPLKSDGEGANASRTSLRFVYTTAIDWVVASPDLNGK